MTTGRKTSAVLTALALASGGAVTLAGGASAAPGGRLVYALTSDERIVQFRTETLSPDSGRSISGLNPGDDVVGIDVRPATGQLFGVVRGTVQDRIVTIDPATGAATAFGTLTVRLMGSAFGVDFNPVPDALRIVSNNGQNLRHVLSTNTTVADGTLTYGADQTAPQVTGAAYTNNVAGTTTTQLFDIDTARDALALQAPPNEGRLTQVGNSLGVGDVLTRNGFDIDPAAPATAFASLETVNGIALYTVDLTSGAATRLGGLPNSVEDIAVATPRFAVVNTSVAEGANAVVTVRRTGDLADAATVDFSTASGSATEGSDFTRTTGTLSFGPGESSKTLSVPTDVAGGAEGAETFAVVLSNPTGSTVLSPGTGTVTIVDGENVRLFVLGTNNTLRTTTLNDPSAAGTLVPINGLATGDDLVGIDVRPATGELYGVGMTGQLYVINTSTGTAARRGNVISPALSGTSFGVDFNPVVDRLRIVSNNGQNLRVNPETGDTIADGALKYAAGDPNAAVTPTVGGAGYTNNVAGAASTVLLDIDTATDSLVRQAPPNEGVLNTVGSLGVALPAATTVGLDVATPGDNAFALLQPDGVTTPTLYRIDTTTGSARSLGAVNASNGVPEDIALGAVTTMPTPGPTATATGTPTASATPTATATASTTPSATASARPTGSTSASPTATVTPSQVAPRQLSISVSPAVIKPGIPSTVTITGTPGSAVELQAYSRPNTTYGVVRRGIIASTGSISFDVNPGTNTRLMAQVTGFPGTASNSTVINVQTALSLTVVRNGRRNYTFQGRILPRRAGQLITLYRVDNGRRIIASQIRTDDTGTYRINRRFTGSGTFGFLTRTGQTLTNAAGESNEGRARPTAIF